MQEINNLNWSEPSCITTSRGPVVAKSADPNGAFWTLWREHRQAMSGAGFSVGKFAGNWKVTWWEREGKFNLPILDRAPIVEQETLPELPPLKYPHGFLSYQPHAVQVLNHAMTELNASLNASGTGTGKTFMTLGVVRERERRILVICPKGIVSDWKDACKAMGVEVAGVFGWEWMKTGKTEFLKWTYKRIKKRVGREFVLVDAKDKLVWNVPDDVDVVFDECHRAANSETIASDMLIDAVASGFPIHLLSATVADNPIKMRAVGYALKLHRNGKDFLDWMKDHGVRKGRFGFEFQGSARHLQSIHKSIFPTRGIRIRADQLGKAFPETQILAKSYDMEESKAIASVYAEMMDKCAEIEARETGSSRAACILVEILRARQKVELLKIPLMVSLTRDYHAEGNSVFMAVNFRETVKVLCEQLKTDHVIVGGQTAEARKDFISRFQSNESNVIIGIIKACREGLNLHDIHGDHPRVSLISPTPSAFDLRQVLGRVWRAGGKTPSLQRILFARDTVEEEVCRSIATKLDQLDLLMDGDLQRGVFPNNYSEMRPQTTDEEE
jgi:hypothetical protein